jgi:HEAT repeat protein
MAFDSDLADLADASKRLSSTQLTSLSDLEPEDAADLAAAWREIETNRRFSIVTELAELAQDNVELNFDAVYKVALGDEEAAVRAAALRGLFEYEGRDLIPVLADVLRDDPEADVRREAAVALGRYALAAELEQLPQIDGAAVREVLIESAEDLEEDERVRARAIEALGAMSGEETENLIESVYEEASLWLKVGAVDAMGRSCNPSWLPLVMREMESMAPEMRHAAAYAAGEIGEEEAVPQLKRIAVDDPDKDVQLVAVRAIGEIGGDQAKVALQAILYEGDDSLQEAVEEAMSEIAFNDDPLQPL